MTYAEFYTANQTTPVVELTDRRSRAPVARIRFTGSLDDAAAYRTGIVDAFTHHGRNNATGLITVSEAIEDGDGFVVYGIFESRYVVR